MRSILNAATALLVGTVLTIAAGAQCPVPDGLDPLPGACCVNATPVAPRVPNFSQDSLGICWRDCSIDSIDPCEAVWSGPTPPDNCRNYAKRLKLKDSAGTVKWNGRIKFRYSRTWVETDATGQTWQVWRYLANGDMRPTAAAGAPPCPVPPCVPAFGNKARFTGYLDVAEACGSGIQEYAWMLSHECDRIDHVAPFPRAGVFHPDRSYTFVGPSAGFVVGALQPIEFGGGITEAVRRIDRVPGSAIDICQVEEQVQHSLSPVTQFCFCGVAAAPPQYALADLSISGACGTTVTTTAAAVLPGFISKGVGSWTLPGTYPGVEVLRWSAGGYQYGDPCTGIAREEAFFGVTTLGGWGASQLSGVTLPTTFVDQGNSVKSNPSFTTLNVPFRSDHILNLNY